MPGARWKPAYDLHYASARGQIRVETSAVVEQATGEDWTDAALLLSTAMPGRGIDLPELLTWTLGEKSEFIPQLRPRRAPPTERAAAGRCRAIERRWTAPRIDAERGPRATGARRATATVHGAAPTRPRQAMRRRARIPGRRAPRAAAQRARHPARPRCWAQAPARAQAFGVVPRPPPGDGAPAAHPARPSEIAMDDAEERSRRALVARLAVVPRNRRHPRAPPATRVPLALVDTRAPSRGPALSDPYLPAVSAGGLDYVYQAPTRATIASSAKQVRIPLASQTFQASTFHEATPALAPTAFLRARVRNDGKRPLLRGPVTIFGDGELVGVGEIQTTGAGGDIELPLGADQDVKLVRQVVPSTKTTGVIMKSEETTYDVQIQVANYKKQKVTVEIADQVPRSPRDKVEVKLLGVQPAAKGAPDADGVDQWRVELGPGATQTLKLGYRITRPKDWQLYQN